MEYNDRIKGMLDLLRRGEGVARHLLDCLGCVF